MRRNGLIQNYGSKDIETIYAKALFRESTDPTIGGADKKHGLLIKAHSRAYFFRFDGFSPVTSSLAASHNRVIACRRSETSEAMILAQTPALLGSADMPT